MPEIAVSEHSWRLDRVEARADSRGRNEASEPGSAGRRASVAADSCAPVADSGSGGLVARWSQLVERWLFRRQDRRAIGSGGFERDVHQFAADIASAHDSAAVEAGLLRLARRLAPASRIELVPVPDSRVNEADEAASHEEESSTEPAMGPAGQFVVDVPLRCGGSVSGMLRVRSRVLRSSQLTDETIGRLTTICTMAACAIESLGRHPAWIGDDEQRPGDARSARLVAPASECTDPREPANSLHDATFLNAVLPFALNQARRHREPLSLLCVAIDRLSAIQELLGRAEVKSLVRHVGETVGSLIRASDIVARLDDDRVVAVLPRAPRRRASSGREALPRPRREEPGRLLDAAHHGLDRRRDISVLRG